MRFAIPREVAMQESDDWEGPPPFANRMKGMTASEIRELLKILDQPDVISFAGGIPDPALFPVAEIDRFSRRILGAADTARSALLGTSLLILRTKACVIGRARRFNSLRIRVGGRTGCKRHRGRNHC